MSSNKNSLSKVGAVLHTRKFLTNLKVRHDRTDKRDPNFNILQDIQSQNDYSTTQLNIMGYKGDMLRAQFCLDEISERMATCRCAHARKEVFCDRMRARDVE